MEDQEFEEIISQLDENPIFAKAQIDPRMVNLQKEVLEFVTSVILNHELEFYQLVKKVFPSKMEDLLCSTGPSIIQMITETTNKFYNKVYYDIQHKNDTPLTKMVLQMCKLTDYGPHILLDKLFRLTLEIHLEVDREKIDLINICNNTYSVSNRKITSAELNSNPEDFYQKSILRQINIGLQSKNLLHIMSKGGDDENTEFVDIPEGEYAFHVMIDKNIGQSYRD